MSKSFQKGKDDDQTKKNAIFQLCLDVDPGDVERCRSVLVIMRTGKKIELPCRDLRRKDPQGRNSAERGLF